ncbi:MAG: glycoside hydrolase family 5 protein, partial [Tannerellaceae bacterium]|nr:glycoside hydrolase family 5 protein [Tannerellaceae bacterium]
MKSLSCSLILLLSLLAACGPADLPQGKSLPPEAFVRVEGTDLITPEGEKLLIRGTNLGNWLNPEGYMFRFGRTNSAGRIHQAFCEMVGPDFVDAFWKLYKDNYVTRDDIRFLKQAGCNTIRLPFHYKL